MKAHYKTANGRIVFEVDGGTQKELFENIAEVQEVYESHSACGKCQSQDIHFRVREVKGNRYYELRCRHCNAQFSFGQNKDMKSLFPKYKDDQGNWLPDRGWFKWSPREEGVA